MAVDWSPVFISMKTASLSILITFFVGLIVAWGIVKMKNDTIKIVLDGIFTLPIVLPPTVVGFFLLYIFGVRGPVGKFFLEFFAVKIAFSWSATVIAAVVMSFPLMYRSLPGIISGGILAYARGLGEFGATAMLAGNIARQTRTLPMAVYSEVAAGNMGEAFNYVIVIVIISFIAIFIMDYFSLRKEKQWRNN